MDHTHGPGGEIIYTEPDPGADDLAAVETTADAAVRIAEIEAGRDVQLARETTKRDALWSEEEKAEVLGELRGVKETLATLMPSPDPAPVPVDLPAAPAPDPPEDDVVPAPAPAPGPDQDPPAKAGFWGPAYT